MIDFIDEELEYDGIESSARFERLGELGCNEVQGYCFARPMPFEELLK